MDVVGHQAPGQASHAALAASRRHEIEVRRIVGFLEEHRQPAIATLRHVMRYAGDHDTGETGYVRAITHKRRGDQFGIASPQLLASPQLQNRTSSLRPMDMLKPLRFSPDGCRLSEMNDYASPVKQSRCILPILTFGYSGSRKITWSRSRWDQAQFSCFRGVHSLESAVILLRRSCLQFLQLRRFSNICCCIAGHTSPLA